MRVGKSYPNSPIGRDVCLTGDEDGLAESVCLLGWIRSRCTGCTGCTGCDWTGDKNSLAEASG